MYFAIFVIMKTSLFLLSALIILAASCKKETTNPTIYQIGASNRDSSNKAIFNGAFTHETEIRWTDFPDSTEDWCKGKAASNTQNYYRDIYRSHGDTSVYTRMMGHYRAKP